MRINALAFFFCFLAPVTILPAQQGAPRPAKVLTPEQQAYQQEARQVRAERDRLRANAKQAFDAEAAREKAGYCPDANTTYDFNICIGHEEDTTEANYKAYTKAVRAFLGLKEPLLPGTEEEPRQSQDLSPEQFVAEFDKTQALWEPYKEGQCTAAFHQFAGGTGAPGFGAECDLRMIREHMRDVDYVYNVKLYH